MPRNTLEQGNSMNNSVNASMRPRRDAAEYRTLHLLRRFFPPASMRPRRDAAEYRYDTSAVD